MNIKQRIRGFTRNTIIELVSLVSKPKNGIYILNGHYTSCQELCGKNKFSQQLNQLKNKYDFIDFEQAVNLIISKDNNALNERLIAFTFDDGFSDCYTEIAPELNKFNVNACFFINSAFIDSTLQYQEEFILNRVKSPKKNPMTWEEIKELDHAGFVIGNHSNDHFRLSELTYDDFFYQVMSSHNKIEEMLNKECKYFAWPFGKMSDIRLDQIDELNKIYKCVFSSDNYEKYFSVDDKVMNRRHVEPFWPESHVKYFLSKGKSY